MSWLFVISWNGIGVESASCYVAECRDPARDAKIALAAEGLSGLFIYAGTAIVFVAVLGASLATADPLTGYTNLAAAIFWQRILGPVRDRHPAHCRSDVVGAQRHHGLRPLVVPGVGRPAVVRFNKPDFNGRQALIDIVKDGLRRTIVWSSLDRSAVMANGDAIRLDGETVGTVTSGSYSPTLGRGVAMGYVEPSHAIQGAAFEIGSDSQTERATLSVMPLYDPGDVRTTGRFAR